MSIAAIVSRVRVLYPFAMMAWRDPVTLSGARAADAKLLATLGIETVGDPLAPAPRRYDDFRRPYRSPCSRTASSVTARRSRKSARCAPSGGMASCARRDKRLVSKSYRRPAPTSHGLKTPTVGQNPACGDGDAAAHGPRVHVAHLGAGRWGTWSLPAWWLVYPLRPASRKRPCGNWSTTSLFASGAAGSAACGDLRVCICLRGWRPSAKMIKSWRPLAEAELPAVAESSANSSSTRLSVR